MRPWYRRGRGLSVVGWQHRPERLYSAICLLREERWQVADVMLMAVYATHVKPQWFSDLL